MKRYILMLEDDGDDRLITETFFAASNNKIDLEFLVNSDDVLPFLEKCERLPNLIILDKNIPASGGMEVLKNLKSHPLYKIIPVVMISGSATPNEIAESYQLGVNSFIVKPFTSERTAVTIRNFLSYWVDSVELPEAKNFLATI